MKLEMKTGFAVMLLILFVVCIFCVGWVGVAGAVELPSTPTPAPTMRVCVQPPPPTPTPTVPGIPMPEPESKLYLPLIIQQKTIISSTRPTPTLAPTMNPFPCEGEN